MSGFLAPTRRSLYQFLAIDPEIFPLIATVSVIFGAAGFVAGQKTTTVDSSKWVRLTPNGYPWSSDEDTGAIYKYKFYKYGDPGAETLAAPGAMVEHLVRVHAPKDKVPQQLLAE
ncbi:hypothetical protein EC973_006194 [Apophysomyces ossiformis]|uniref:Uncharacterized protein n=1 Tax=Apophysomyces ossiformis TaxID=679940 RepID=A0A8H7BYY3_9FUNG|nr:hypothetical protein EC973_006194 [Apophysomyces ossiformis]